MTTAYEYINIIFQSSTLINTYKCEFMHLLIIFPSSAKLQVQLEAEFSFNLNSTLLAWNQQNLLSNIGRSTLVESKSILKNLEIGKTTSMEDNLHGRRHQWKTTSVEDDHSRRQPQWKTTSVEDDLISLKSAKLAL